MKCNLNKEQNVSYRFRQWSQKSYAAFNSIGKEVSIGVLSVVISEKVGVKASFYTKNLFIDWNNNTSEVQKDEDSEKQNFFLLMEMSFIALLLILFSFSDNGYGFSSNEIQFSIFNCAFLIIFFLSPSSFLPSFLSLIYNKKYFRIIVLRHSFDLYFLVTFFNQLFYEN